MDETAIRWGKRIKERRELLHMTQWDLAHEVGTDQSTVSKWELGKFAPSRFFIPRIAKALHARVEILFEYPAEAA